MHDRGLARRLLLVGLAVAGIAACGQATPSASPSAAQSVLVTTPPDTAPTPTSTPAQLQTVAPEPTETDAGSPGTPPCLAAELKASRGITEVDADDRVTEVVLVAAGTCSVDAFPTLQLQDAGGSVLVSAGPAGTGGIDLVGGVAYMAEVRLSNWCQGDPDYPVRIGIVLADRAVVLVTGDSFPDDGDLPPCAHDDAGPVLSATGWQPSS